MKVLIKATVEWTEEVTDDDLKDIIEEHLLDSNPDDDDVKDEAFNIWQEDHEEWITSYFDEVISEADYKVSNISIVVTK